MRDPVSVGRSGEEEASAYLQRSGYRVRERNYRTRQGEIDLVAEEGEFLVFAEVKTRSHLSRGLPREAVGRRKRRRMTRAAFQYIAECGEERPCRFDVVEVLYLRGGTTAVEIIRDAFQPDERDLTW